MLGAALLPDTVFKAAAQVKAIGIGSSPPCKSHSTAPLAEGQEPSEPPMLRQTHEMLTAHGLHYWVENVLGAEAGTLDAHECVQRGSMHGLHVDRPRRFWTSFEVHLDEALVQGGRRLQAGACLGGRRRFLRLDPMGRPDRHVCCAGNLYAVQGTAPTRSTVEENAAAMGIDAGHMGWETLAQSVMPLLSLHPRPNLHLQPHLHTPHLTLIFTQIRSIAPSRLRLLRGGVASARRHGRHG